eukprot:1384610-Rhodomonas_salina.1
MASGPWHILRVIYTYTVTLSHNRHPFLDVTLQETRCPETDSGPGPGVTRDSERVQAGSLARPGVT